MKNLLFCFLPIPARLMPCIRTGLAVAFGVGGCLPVVAQTAGGTPPARLASGVFQVDQIPLVPTPVGQRRAVFEAPTATVDMTHCHVTTLNVGASSGTPRKHLQEEIIIIKEGSIEANWDGQSKVANAGDVIFFAANAVTHMRNVGKVPATYYVIYYFTPLTAKE